MKSSVVRGLRWTQLEDKTQWVRPVLEPLMEMLKVTVTNANGCRRNSSSTSGGGGPMENTRDGARSSEMAEKQRSHRSSLPAPGAPLKKVSAHHGLLSMRQGRSSGATTRDRLPPWRMPSASSKLRHAIAMYKKDLKQGRNVSV